MGGQCRVAGNCFRPIGIESHSRQESHIGITYAVKNIYRKVERSMSTQWVSSNVKVGSGDLVRVQECRNGTRVPREETGVVRNGERDEKTDRILLANMSVHYVAALECTLRLAGERGKMQSGVWTVWAREGALTQ